MRSNRTQREALLSAELAETQERLGAALVALTACGYGLDGVTSIREELRLVEGLPPGRVLYIDRMFREAYDALALCRDLLEGGSE